MGASGHPPYRVSTGASSARRGRWCDVSSLERGVSPDDGSRIPCRCRLSPNAHCFRRPRDLRGGAGGDCALGVVRRTPSVDAGVSRGSRVRENARAW